MDAAAIRMLYFDLTDKRGRPNAPGTRTCAVDQLCDFLDSQVFAWSALRVLDPLRRNCPIFSVWCCSPPAYLALEILECGFITVPKRSIFGTVEVYHPFGRVLCRRVLRGHVRTPTPVSTCEP